MFRDPFPPASCLLPGDHSGGRRVRPMTLLLWTLLPSPWNYCAAVAPVAGFFATRWLWQRLRVPPRRPGGT